MTWHHALDVRSEADCHFCAKTLRNYRRLFIAEGLDEALFRRMTDRRMTDRRMTDRHVRAFSVDTRRQRMDPTALRSAMRCLTRLGIVVETISKFARELARFHPVLHEQFDVTQEEQDTMTFSRVSMGSGGTRDGRVLSSLRPATPSSRYRCCQRQTVGFDVFARRMISKVP